jgi:hypothetical protein
MVFNMRSTMEPMRPCIAARKGQGNRLLKRFAGLWHAQQNDLDAIVLRSVIG